MGRNVRFRKVYLKHHLSLTVLKTYSSVSTFLIHLINSIWLFYHTTDISIIRIGTVPNRTVPYATVSYRTVPYHTVPYRTLQYPTELYRTIPYRTVRYSILPYCTVPYRTFIIALLKRHITVIVQRTLTS